MALRAKPTNMRREWAVSAPGGNIVDPDTVTANKFADGWVAEIPPFEFFNFIQNHMTAALAHINDSGVPMWDSVSEYDPGSLVRSTVTGDLYQARVTTTNNEPSVSSTQWARLTSGGALFLDPATVFQGQTNIQVFTASGTYAPSANLKFAEVIVVGGGGGGGGCVGGPVNGLQAGGGGGGGGVAVSILSAATIGAGGAVVIGAGGAGVVAGSTSFGSAGGTSSLLGISASGGGGGVTSQSGLSTNQNAAFGGQGAGGNLINTWGEPGTPFAYLPGNANDAYGVIPKGGSSYLFSGGTYSGANSGGFVASGQPGAFGCGGGGGNSIGIAFNDRAGGAGAAGVVIVKEYI